MPNQARSRFDFRCPRGHEFHRALTTGEFLDNEHRCPKCKRAGKRFVPIGATLSAGTVVPGCRAQYPYYNWQLPVLPGQKPGEQIVQSAHHEREIMRGSWGKGGQRYERNAI